MKYIVVGVTVLFLAVSSLNAFAKPEEAGCKPDCTSAPVETELANY